MLLQFSTKTAEADTSSELAKKSKETFRKEVSQRLCKQCSQEYYLIRHFSTHVEVKAFSPCYL